MKGLADINWLFHKYYGDNPKLRRIVTLHSEQVAKKALEINKKKKLKLNPMDVYCAAILHDIGVVKCQAADIHAKGHLPYLQHGIEGKKILLKHGLYQYASVCETHTGAGISKKEITEKNLPLPQKNMLPSTLLEKLICYSDKFFSKGGDLTREKSVEDIMVQMKKYGEDSYQRFMKLHELFGDDNK